MLSKTRILQNTATCMCMQGTMPAELLSVLAKSICIRTLQSNTGEKEQREETLMQMTG